MDDHELLLFIQDQLDGVEWTPETLDRIAAAMTESGYRIRLNDTAPDAGEHTFHYRSWQTGGGMMAYRHDLPDGTYLLICDENNDITGSAAAQIWTVGRYNNENGFVFREQKFTLGDAVEEAKSLPVPVGDQQVTI